MTALTDHCDTIRSWLNFEYDDTLIISWTRMAEELLSTMLRCKHMIAIDVAEVEQQRVRLPSDWLDLDFVRIVDKYPILFRTRDAFYTIPSSDRNYNSRHYTIVGNYLVVGAKVDDGVPVEISYYEAIPPLGEDKNWLMTYYSRLYIAATLSVATGYSIEDDRATLWQTSMQTFVDAINEEHTKSKSSGSKLIIPQRRGFS